MSKKNKTWKVKYSLLNYFKPSLALKNFSELDIFLLKTNNIKLFICDLDNTLAPVINAAPSFAAKKFVKDIQNMGILFYVCSNNHKGRVKKYCDALKPDGYRSFCMKPFVFRLKRLIKKLNIKPEEVLMMGDEFVTDIFAANKLGCKSILVLPLGGQGRSTSTKFTQFLEKKVHKRLAKSNMLLTYKTFKNDTKLL